MTTKNCRLEPYQQNLVSVGSNAANSATNGVNDKLYAVKHNPFLYFNTVQNGIDPVTGKPQLNNIVPLEEPSVGLIADLANGKIPNFSFIAPNQCNDMHGDTAAPSPCANYTDAQLIHQGDETVKNLITQIQSSSSWSKGNNAIYLLWDENDYGPESNQVPLIAITNSGLAGVKDDTPYNHYSLLRTIEDGFALGYLNHAGDETTQPLKPLVIVPESSSNLGLCFLAVFAASSLLKRKLSRSST